jgi:uncharacterized protein YggL (DUF469 family)
VSLRAETIQNITMAIKKSLENATQAQTIAESTLEKINEAIEKARETMSGSEEDVSLLEIRAKEALERVQKLQNITGNFFHTNFLKFITIKS